MSTGQSSETPLALARMRVAGSSPLTGDRRTMSALEAAAEGAGRRLVDVTTEDSTTLEVALGWVEGSEPVAGGDSGVVRVDPPGETVLTFAAALRACWLDASEHPFPGAAAGVDTVLEARAILGTLSGSDGNDGRSAEFHRKGALRRLRAAGYLSGTETTVRLGPRVATWSEGQVEVLRAVYEQFPVASDTGTATDADSEAEPDEDTAAPDEPFDLEVEVD